MTTINTRKVTIINRGLTTVVLAICFLLSLSQSQEAYAEMKKVSGTSTGDVRLAETKIAVAYSPKKGRLSVYHSVLNSADPDWNNAPFFYIVYDESAKEWDDRGYGVITHPGGDQTFIKFEGRRISYAALDEATGEHKGFFIGGTGKFEDIKARWLLKWTMKVGEGTVGEWAVEYF
jgi:hypothetical protein